MSRPGRANERGPVEEVAGSRVSVCHFSPVVVLDESGSTHNRTGLPMPVNKTLPFLRIRSYLTDMEYVIEYHIDATMYRWRTVVAPALASGLHCPFVLLSCLFSVYLTLFLFKKQYSFVLNYKWICFF
jgi:hypothetical protein